MMPLFKKKNHQIIFFPKQLYYVFGISFLIFAAINAYVLYSIIGLELDLIALVLLAAIIMTLPFFLWGSQKIIIDQRTRTIFKKHAFGQKTLAHFHEVDAIVSVQDMLKGQSMEATSYFIKLKNDPHGKGIKLNWSTRNNAQRHIHLKQEIEQLRTIFNLT